jgi:hypothetical protein
MLSHLSTYSLRDEADLATGKWLSSSSYNEKYDVPTSKSVVAALEVLLGLGAVALLVLSQQSWPEGFWLNHTAVFISSSAVSGLVGLDVLIALGVRLYACSFPPEAQPKLENTKWVEHSAWEPTAMHSKGINDEWSSNFKEPFFTALGKLGLSPEGLYELIIFRPVTRMRPGLFTKDGVAPDFMLLDGKDDNPLNLKNYSPNSIMVVTFCYEITADEKKLYFEGVIANDPCAPHNDTLKDGNTAKVEYLGDQFVHVHFNQHDYQLLVDKGLLTRPIAKVIQEKISFGSRQQLTK